MCSTAPIIGTAKVCFEIAVAVPVDYAYRVARPYAQALQRARQTSYSLPECAHRVASQVAVDDLLLGANSPAPR